MFREYAAQSKVKKDLEDEILRLLSADGDILESKATSTDLLDRGERPQAELSC